MSAHGLSRAPLVIRGWFGDHHRQLVLESAVEHNGFAPGEELLGVPGLPSTKAIRAVA